MRRSRRWWHHLPLVVLCFFGFFYETSVSGFVQHKSLLSASPSKGPVITRTKEPPSLTSIVPYSDTRRPTSDTTLCLTNRNAVTQSSSPDTNNPNENLLLERPPDELLGTLVLLTVPLSWGTYSPVVRYLYAIDPPVPGFVFSACYYTLAAVTTLCLAQRFKSNGQQTDNTDGKETELLLEYTKESSSSLLPSSVQGGIELGSYLFVANCLQVVGLQTVEAERAGFLVQLTTVMVPLTEALLAGSLSKVPTKTWIACLVAFLGLCIMGLDGKEDSIVLSDPGDALVGAITSFSQGDGLILGAAALYTLHVVRLGTYARQTTPMKLAASKATTESIQSIGLIAVLIGWSSISPTESSNSLLSFAASTGQEISDFFVSFSARLANGSLPTSALVSAMGAIFWTGWVTCAYTIWAQSYGQSKVSPTNANLIYTFQPIFTSLFAYLLLGETMGPAGFIGGSLIASAVYAVAEPVPSGRIPKGSSSSASHFLKNFQIVSAETAENNFYGIQLSNNVAEAPSWSILALVMVVIAIIFQPKRYQQRPSLSLSFWIAILAIILAAPQTTLVPLLTTIIHTRTSYPYLVVIPHCIVSAAAYRSNHGDNTNYLQSLLLSFLLYGFGGSIVSDVLMGLPATALSHPRIIPCYVLGWMLVWFCPQDWVYQSYSNSKSALSYVLKGFEAIDAVTTPMGRVSRSARELPNKITAPIVAGLLAGVGGGGVRYAVSEPSASMAALESAFWKTLSYSVLWWWLAVYQCNNENAMLFHFDQNWNHCGSYNGADLLRVIIVTGHTIWVLLAETNVVRGHPFVWICRKVFVEGFSKVSVMLQLGPTAALESDRKKND
ncbi:EamA-like transporter family protein [Nitzschia inconspicua]|uniref:EamA-like transporter family protein n=1 Tax=Nitzschia inconspicua TaxID=303405 RepID=A0A9K3KWX6_9STRA|nr:EamA-like transporter family protein [Nitzschia inconspicua]